MKTKEIIWWILLLVVIDQATKIVIYHFYMDTHFEIIPSLFEFSPVFNDKHSYVNYLLNQKLNINMGFWIHIVIFTVAECIILALYIFLRSLSKKTKLLDTAITFQIAGLICALLGNIVWKKGVLDFIYLKPLFVFDLKDLYNNCFVVFLLIYVHKYREKVNTTNIKEVINLLRNR
ncbi:signal peptidase II [Parabacteroides segnis]|uniref:signal peptidase II n=1 Tax=Parabacteroides segnis TaxID=2763058 RepID=UPI00351336EC